MTLYKSPDGCIHDDMNGTALYLLPENSVELTPTEIDNLLNINVPITPPIYVPQILTNYQGKVTLDAFRMYEEVEALMQREDTPRAAKFAWATGAFERQGTLVLSFAGLLGIAEEQLDTMFIYGAKVQ